jgi:hypothetical protein
MQAYIKADQQIHWLCQVIAKVNRAYVPEKEDDSHTNLYFDAVGSRILGRWIDGPDGKMIFTLNLNNYCFEWLDGKLTTRAKVSVFNKDLDMLNKEISEYPFAKGIDIEKLFKPLHFEIPNYKFNRLTENELSAEAVRQWKYYRGIANMACLSLLGYLQLESEIRIWPHHFDTGIYTKISESPGIGFGLAMADSMINIPYFYITGYAGNKQVQYDHLNDLQSGRWVITNNWNGAVLPLSELSGKLFREAEKEIFGFIRQAGDWFLKQDI